MDQGLVIVFLTRRVTELPSSVKEKQRVVMSAQTGGVRDPSVSEGILVWTAACKSFKHTEARRAAAVPFARSRDAVTRVLACSCSAMRIV